MRQLGPGDEIFGYRIEAIVGRGGMGLVYRARQRRPDRTVAIKVIAPELAADPGFRARFELESATAAEIEHPNVIPVYGVGEEDGLLFIAMRFVHGVDLGGLLAQSGRLEPRRAGRIISQVAEALDSAHARGLVHRDIKPGNILVTGSDHVYLTDFGLTKRISETRGMTQAGAFVGTVNYIAPEQVEGRRVDASADVYALGCVAYELLSGSVPFPRESEIATIFAHVNEPPPRLGHVPPPLATAVQRAMAKRPADRFLSAGDFGRAVLAGASGQADHGDGRSVAIGEATIADLPVPTELVGPESIQAPTLDEHVVRSAPLSNSTQRQSEIESKPVAVEPTHLKLGTAPPARALPPHLRDRAPDGRGSRGRAHRLAPALGLLAVALAAGVLVIALSGGNARRTTTKAVPTTARTVSNPTPTLTLKQDVSTLDSILQLFIKGKPLSKNRQFQAAIANRTQVLHELKAFQALPQLRDAAETLRKMTENALINNQFLLHGQPDRAKPFDLAHNNLRGILLFTNRFNFYAGRLLGHHYAIGQL